MTLATVTTLVLDLEGTLISNAISCFPRPGLLQFLDFCHERFSRIVMYTGVPDEKFRQVARQLAREGEVSPWFPHTWHVHLEGGYKDLGAIEGVTPASALILDDMEERIHPEQKDRWIKIEPFAPPYPEDDCELQRMTKVLESRLGASSIKPTRASHQKRG